MSLFAAPSDTGALRQGEILSNVVQVHLRIDSLTPGVDEAVFEERIHPFALILTQDCDLDWDFKARQSSTDENRRELKIVPNTLFCELMANETLRPRIGGSDLWRRISQNQDERYHAFPAIPAEHERVAQGIPQLVADFKRLFTIPTDELYARLTMSTQRRAVLQGPYLQHFTTRFGYYCMRVALPDPATPQLVAKTLVVEGPSGAPRKLMRQRCPHLRFSPTVNDSGGRGKREQQRTEDPSANSSRTFERTA
ncbi:MAG: hypothetical protein ACLQU1_01235 [Bryobacteraceae bacterium]